MANNLKPKPTPLPTTIDEWERKVKDQPTLNDQVEALHRSFYNESAEYRDFLEAVWDSDAREGSLAIDNTMAAQALRCKAQEVDNGGPIATKKLDTIVKALNVVLRRYEKDRKTRRNTVAGVRVANPNEDDDNGK
jgi:hypothetical protein